MRDSRLRMDVSQVGGQKWPTATHAAGSPKSASTTAATSTVASARRVVVSRAWRTAITMATSDQGKPTTSPMPGSTMSSPGAAANPSARCISPMSAHPPKSDVPTAIVTKAHATHATRNPAAMTRSEDHPGVPPRMRPAATLPMPPATDARRTTRSACPPAVLSCSTSSKSSASSWMARRTRPGNDFIGRAPSCAAHRALPVRFRPSARATRRPVGHRRCGTAAVDTIACAGCRARRA